MNPRHTSAQVAADKEQKDIFKCVLDALVQIQISILAKMEVDQEIANEVKTRRPSILLST